MAGRDFLYILGSTNVPRRVQNAISVEQEDMHGRDLPEFTKPLYIDMEKVFKTENGRAFIFPSSDPDAWESVITNTLKPGSKVLASRFGQFSHLFIDCAQRLGMEVIEVDCEWGVGSPADNFSEVLAADKKYEIKAVFATNNVNDPTKWCRNEYEGSRLSN